MTIRLPQPISASFSDVSCHCRNITCPPHCSEQDSSAVSATVFCSNSSIFNIPSTSPALPSLSRNPHVSIKRKCHAASASLLISFDYWPRTEIEIELAEIMSRLIITFTVCSWQIQVGWISAPCGSFWIPLVINFCINTTGEYPVHGEYGRILKIWHLCIL